MRSHRNSGIVDSISRSSSLLATSFAQVFLTVRIRGTGRAGGIDRMRVEILPDGLVKEFAIGIFG
jgi:hypothetical protein